MQRGFAEIQEFELTERRNATPASRMRQVDSIWSIAVELGISLEQRSVDPLVRDQWSRLRKAVSERDRSASK
jgi:hypothetical protein